MTNIQGSMRQKSRIFWFGILYALLLSIDVGAIFLIANDTESDVSIYIDESGFEGDAASTADLATPIPRLAQAAQFTHPFQTVKVFLAVDATPYLHDTIQLDLFADNFLLQVPWFYTQGHGQTNRLSGWKDSNQLFKSLSSIRT